MNESAREEVMYEARTAFVLALAIASTLDEDASDTLIENAMDAFEEAIRKDEREASRGAE